jgi:hypothetical protein
MLKIKLKAIAHFLFILLPFFISTGLETIIFRNCKVVDYSIDVMRIDDRKQKVVSYLQKLYKES